MWTYLKLYKEQCPSHPDEQYIAKNGDNSMKTSMTYGSPVFEK